MSGESIRLSYDLAVSWTPNQNVTEERNMLDNLILSVFRKECPAVSNHKE
jgi:hypothetical protein